MATFNRFTSKKSPTVLNDEDDEEYQKIAAKKLAVTQPVATKAPTPVAAPKTAPAPKPMLETKPSLPALQPTQKPVVAPAPNVAVQAPARAPVNQPGTVAAPLRPVVQPTPVARPTRNAVAAAETESASRAAAMQRMDEEDARGGLRTGSAHDTGGGINTDTGGGGINVAGNGNREEVYGDDSGVNGETDRQRAAREAREREEAIKAAKAKSQLKNLQENDLDNLGNQVESAQDDDEIGHTEADAKRVEQIQTRKTDSPDDDMADIARARLEAEQKTERDAQAAELKASKQKALMMANARAQLAGMGLSGSTAALEGDVARKADRSNTLAMADLGRSQRDEGRDDRRLTAQETRADADAEFVKLQRKLAINMLEEQSGRDEDGDGLVAGLTQEQIDRQDRLEDVAAARDERKAKEAAEFVGHIGHTVAFDGELPIPRGVDVSDARTVGTVNPTDQHYVGTKDGYHYFQSASTGEFVRVEAT